MTRSGRTAFEPLDARSNDEVRRLVGAIAPSDATRLLQAMRTIEGVLEPKSKSPSPYLLRTHRPGDMGWVVYRHGVLYSEEWGYDERFEALVAQIVGEFVQRFDLARERCWIAEKDGEIMIRGKNVMQGYYHNPEETAKVLDNEGFYHTGDVG